MCPSKTSCLTELDQTCSLQCYLNNKLLILTSDTFNIIIRISLVQNLLYNTMEFSINAMES